MDEPLEPAVVVPYARFLECAERRRLVALALARATAPAPGGAVAPPIPEQPPKSISTAWRYV